MDEDIRRPAPALGLPRPLEGVSIAELEAYRALLVQEIARVDAELARRSALRSAAESLFRPPRTDEAR